MPHTRTAPRRHHHIDNFPQTHHSTLQTYKPPTLHHASTFIIFLKSGVNLEANVTAHEFPRPLTDPQPLLKSDTSPSYTLQIDLNSTPSHQDTRSWFFLTLHDHLAIIPKTLLPEPQALPPTIRLIADAHCILPLNPSLVTRPLQPFQPFAIHILPSARLALLTPHPTLPIYISFHTQQTASTQLPLRIADIHPGLGSSTYVLSLFQQLHILDIHACPTQRHRTGILHSNFPALCHKINTHHLNSIEFFHAIRTAHGLVFSSEHKIDSPQLSAYILEALFLTRIISPYFAIIFGPANVSFSPTQNATILLHAQRFGYHVTTHHHHTSHLIPYRGYQPSWILSRIDSASHPQQTTDLQQITSFLRQQVGLTATITERNLFHNLSPTPVQTQTLSQSPYEDNISSRDTGQLLGPLSATYGSLPCSPYDRWLLHEQQPFWIPMRAFARAIGFPDSFRLYHNSAESAAALSTSTSPVSFALSLSIALLHCGINIIISPLSPVTQIILQAIPLRAPSLLSPLSKLLIIGVTESLAQLIIHHAPAQAAEITHAFATRGVTCTDSLAILSSSINSLNTFKPHLQAPIRIILDALTISQVATTSSHHNHLPLHLKSTWRNLSSPQRAHFEKYISPLLAPLHALTQNISQAYLQLIKQSLQQHTHQLTMLQLSIGISAIQDSAAKIIIFLIPPFHPLELLHRTLCITLLKNLSPQCFTSTHTSTITSRTLLGRF